MSTFTSEPGARLADRYRLEDRVNAATGWAEWKAIDEILARAVTVLTFASDFPRVAEVVTAARAASRLTDSRLAQVFDVEDGGDDRAYIVMEWVAGDSLDDLLGNGPLDPAQGVALITEASKALAGAHTAGLAHLCLTPDSLRWTPGGGVKLVGLGIAAALDGITADDPALADTHGLGKLLYATLTGHWAGPESTSLPPAPMAEGLPCTPRQVRAGVPAAIDAVACEALFGRPRRDRPPVTTPALLAQALAEVAVGNGQPGPSPVDGFAVSPRLTESGRDTFAWGTGAQTRSGTPLRNGRHQSAPGQRAVTTGVVLGIAIVLVLAAIGIGGWVLSHRAAGHKASGGHSSHPPTGSTPTVLQPASANATDNPGGAGLAIDRSPKTFWYSSWYQGSPLFGHLTTGIGLVVDMGRTVKLSQLQVLFGASTGVNVQIKMSNSSAPPSPAEAASLPTVAQATDIGGAHTFTVKGSATGRDVVIWFTKLPPQPHTTNRYQVNIYNIVARGTG
jgi:serine/threonine protein kinase